MTKFVILGHGNFDVTSTEYPPEILVPPNTSLQFFTDTGQSLWLSSGDYAPAAGKIWDQLKQFGSPLGPGGVTNNYILKPDSTEAHRQSARKVDWGGATPFFL